jgi:hypothetical protein
MTIHNNPNPTQEEIRDELTTEFNFPAEPPSFLEECVQIASFLSNPVKVEQGLKELEQDLKARVDTRFDRILEHYKNKVANVASQLDQDLKHLLSQEMTLREIEWGFSSFSISTDKGYRQGEKVQTYTKFQPGQAFRNEIALKRHWKDPTVPGLHGEYTHRLQWFLIGTQLKAEIKRPISEIYGQIGPIQRNSQTKKFYGLWYALCDRDGGDDPNGPFKIAAPVTDCRSPESMTKFIIDAGNEAHFPLLHWFISSRMKKRQATAMNTWPGRNQYIASKLKKYGLPDQRANIQAIGGTFRDLGAAGTGIIRSGNEIRHQ